MTANLYQNRIAYNKREVPWHGEGTAIDDDISCLQALEVSQTDIQIVLAHPTGLAYKDENGQDVVINDNFDDPTDGTVVLRLPSYEDTSYSILGKASDNYTILSNKEFATMLEPLRKWGRVETVGALGKGERFFMTFEGTPWNIDLNGKIDTQKTYLIAKGVHIPGVANQIQIAHTRVVCENTWFASDETSILNIPLDHRSDLKIMTQWVIDEMDKLPAKQKKIEEAAKYLTRFNLNDDMVEESLDFVLPLPKRSQILQLADTQTTNLMPLSPDIQTAINTRDKQYMTMLQRMQYLRDGVKKTYEESATVDRGTAWGLLNAYTETIDWLVRNPKAAYQTRKVLTSNFWGERADMKKKAWSFLLKETEYA